METIGTWWMWTGFAVFVVVAIAIDLLVMERQGAHKVTMGEAAALEPVVVRPGLCVCGPPVVVPGWQPGPHGGQHGVDAVHHRLSGGKEPVDGQHLCLSDAV